MKILWYLGFIIKHYFIYLNGNLTKINEKIINGMVYILVEVNMLILDNLYMDKRKVMTLLNLLTMIY